MQVENEVERFKRKTPLSYPPRPDNWMDDYLEFDNAK